MKIHNKKYIGGEAIKSVCLKSKTIEIELINGKKITCKSIGSMNLSSWIDYSKDIDSL